MAAKGWRMYIADMEGFVTSTVFNDAIGPRVNDLPQTHSLKARLPLKAPRADGLVTAQEAEELGRLDEAMGALITGAGGEYLGRVTVRGQRWVLALVNPPAEALQQALENAARDAGYAIDIFIDADPAKTVYWQDLYPSDDTRQVMRDLEVQELLRQGGDNSAAVRTIGHWTYFRDSAPAERFADWARSSAYEDVTVEDRGEAGNGEKIWLVRMSHKGNTVLGDLSAHSLAISRKARSLGGMYDGWEAPVAS